MAERLLSTSYRFEVYNPNTKMLKKAMSNQNARIQMDELIASRTAEDSFLAREFNRSTWLSNLDEKSESRRNKAESVLIKKELESTNKELLMLRKDRLKKLLEQDAKHYQEELNEQGKALYVKRV